jgi:hypothetical protein
LFAGLNVLPKATYATDYSSKTERAMTERLIAAAIAKTPLESYSVGSLRRARIFAADHAAVPIAAGIP